MADLYAISFSEHFKNIFRACVVSSVDGSFGNGGNSQKVKERQIVKYISNGSKNISHKTNYHEYFIRYFCFRKAVRIKLFRDVAFILYMEEIYRIFHIKYNKETKR